jgi:uncharacterized protein
MQHKHTNELINETSPYLLQHAHNPVNWQGWNEQAWARARAEDKPVIVSIGYSACHWCHVMEHESFEDEVVAQIMNDHFICIKVDREERPDVDQIYMDACQLISGRGGWPLNAVTLPDGRPIYAGTYFPKENWKQVLLYFVNYWKTQREEALERAQQITHGIRVMDAIEVKTDVPDFTTNDRGLLFQKIDATWDYQLGGRSGAPKFPMPVTLQYLMQNYYYTTNEKALQALTVTLDGMMNGGIYDQLGGGFARYSVDAHWEIPHFEKMMYDNAQLVSLYAMAYRVTKNVRYKEVVYETLEFVNRELSDASGGFYSALDADSEGEEGKFYVWSYDELIELLGAEFAAFAGVFEITPEGNFEGHINLVRKPNVVADAQQLERWKTTLLAERAKRIRPGLDDKILTSWNALMLKGYVDAYTTFGEERFLQRGLRCAAFIKSNLIQPNNSINRNYKNGKITIQGFLDDYSFTCEAFIALYQASFDEQWLQTAKALADYAVQHFYNLNTRLFFYTGINDEPLIARKTETQDNVIPSSNSSLAKALFQLGVLYDSDDYKQKAKKALHVMRENVLTHPAFYANWAMLADWFIDEPFEVAITGTNALELGKEAGTYFKPDNILMGTLNGSELPLLKDKLKPGETNAYVCYRRTCGLPAKSFTDALIQMVR